MQVWVERREEEERRRGEEGKGLDSWKTIDLESWRTGELEI